MCTKLKSYLLLGLVCLAPSCVSAKESLDVGLRQNYEDANKIKQYVSDISEHAEVVEEAVTVVLPNIEDAEDQATLKVAVDSAKVIQEKAKETGVVIDEVIERTTELTYELKDVQDKPSGFFGGLRSFLSSLKNLVILVAVLALLMLGSTYGFPMMSRMLIGLMTRFGIGVGNKVSEMGKLLHRANKNPSEANMAAITVAYRASSRPAEASYRRAKTQQSKNQPILSDEGRPPPET